MGPVQRVRIPGRERAVSRNRSLMVVPAFAVGLILFTIHMFPLTSDEQFALISCKLRQLGERFDRKSMTTPAQALPTNLYVSTCRLIIDFLNISSRDESFSKPKPNVYSEQEYFLVHKSRVARVTTCLSNPLLQKALQNFVKPFALQDVDCLW